MSHSLHFPFFPLFSFRFIENVCRVERIDRSLRRFVLEMHIKLHTHAQCRIFEPWVCGYCQQAKFRGDTRIPFRVKNQKKITINDGQHTAIRCGI